mmetsp:Transcript_79638/g.258086  ORF Transcript_79638/g.258086 Transcript_79638/m.258086 type:complete len:226 (+) Transcript_79638:538-1215(+)
MTEQTDVGICQALGVVPRRPHPTKAHHTGGDTCSMTACRESRTKHWPTRGPRRCLMAGSYRMLQGFQPRCFSRGDDLRRGAHGRRDPQASAVEAHHLELQLSGVRCDQLPCQRRTPCTHTFRSLATSHRCPQPGVQGNSVGEEACSAPPRTIGLQNGCCKLLRQRGRWDRQKRCSPQPLRRYEACSQLLFDSQRGLDGRQTGEAGTHRFPAIPQLRHRISSGGTC